MIKDVIDMVAEKLTEDGFDGLVNDNGECGCELGDLAPCGQIESSCMQAYKSAHSVTGVVVFSTERNLPDKRIEAIGEV